MPNVRYFYLVLALSASVLGGSMALVSSAQPAVRQESREHVPTRKSVRFVIGDVVTSAVDCLPTVGCFGEEFTVKAVGDDGWIRVAYVKGGPEWWLNPAQMYGVLIHPAGLLARAK